VSDDDDHNKTIMIRRPAAGETPAAAPPAKEAPAPAPKQEEASWIKSPAGIITLVVVVVIAVFAVIKLTGK
jgi:hypothetical protein